MLLLIARISFLTKLIIYRLALLLSRSYLEISFGQIGITANLLSEEVVHQIQMDLFWEELWLLVTGRSSWKGRAKTKNRSLRDRAFRETGQRESLSETFGVTHSDCKSLFTSGNLHLRFFNANRCGSVQRRLFTEGYRIPTQLMIDTNCYKL